MKKFNNIAIAYILLVASLGVSSCSNSFLDEDLTTELSTDWFDTPQGLEDLTVSLYGNIRWHFGYEWAYGTTLYGTDEFTNANDLTNEMWNTYDTRLNAADPKRSTGATNDNATGPSFLWDQLYYGIASANTIIAKANDVISDETQRNHCIAHAYFLRGYNYYKLTAQYGGVVLQTTPINDVVRNFVRSSEEECWEQVISDLRNAYEHFNGENFVYGKGITWTKATAAHFLAKALLFRASERCSEWNSAYVQSDLEEAIEVASYAIGARTLATNYSDLFANWDGVDCETEQLDEILMAAGFNSSSAAKGRFGNRVWAYFNPQFSQFAGGWVRRGVWNGVGFQRCRPTEYSYAVFDHENDARMWKTFRTVYGVNNIISDNENPHNPNDTIKLGDPAVVMILNTKDDDTYNSYTFGSTSQSPNWFDEHGRLAEWSKDTRQTPTEGGLTSEVGQWVPASSILYQNGQYVAPNFKSDWAEHCNFFAGINKVEDGTRNGEKGNSNRDVTMARIAETYLIRAECYVRLGDYGNAQTDINTIRSRAQWQSGENRSYYTDGNQAFESNSLYTDGSVQTYENARLNMNTYYLSNPNIKVTTNASNLQISGFPSTLPAEDEAILERIGVAGDKERAIHFILNERSRELLGEWQRWETLSRTGTLITRASAFNPEAAVGISANKHEYRAIPQKFLDGLLNDDGSNLSQDQQEAWQNPGY